MIQSFEIWCDYCLKTKYYDDHIKGITSFEKKHLKKHGVKSSHIEIEKIKTYAL